LLQDLFAHAALGFADADVAPGADAAYTEERRQRLLGHARAPELAEASGVPAAALESVIEAERSRERGELGAWDGLLLHSGISAGLRAAVERDLRARVLSTTASATQLDTFASCPFRYFAGRVLGLSPLAEPLATDQTLAGQLVHAILCDFYRGLTASGEAGARLLRGPAAFDSHDRARGERAWIDAARPAMLRACHQQLVRVAPGRVDAFFSGLAQKLLAGLEASSADGEGLLEAFLRCEAVALWEHEPLAFELAFGPVRPVLGSGGPRLPALVVDVPGQQAVRLQGAIDRVDRRRAGSGGAVVVFDYKTGRTLPRRGLIELGYRFQLVVYLAALAQEYEPEAAGYYRLADVAEVRRTLLLASDGVSAGELIDRLPEAIRHLACAARGGRFHPGHLPERDKGCSYCDFAVACRVDHDRLHAISLRRPDGLMIPLPLAGGGAP
jgi:RecB family exonuclease